MDELFQLQKDLHEAKENLGKLASDVKKSAMAEANTHSDYEEKKNSLLIILYDEEVENSKKRTGAERTAIYRDRFKEQRREWLIAKADFESNRDLFRGLQSKVEALRTLISLEKAKMNL